MEASKFVTLTYVVTFALAVFIFSLFFDWIFILVDAFNQVALIGTVLTLTNFLALVAGILLIVWMKRHPDIDPFIHETVLELRKVTWPGWQDTQRSTVIVVAFSVILAFSLWFMDQVWERVTDYILTFGL